MTINYATIMTIATYLKSSNVISDPLQLAHLLTSHLLVGLPIGRLSVRRCHVVSWVIEGYFIGCYPEEGWDVFKFIFLEVGISLRTTVLWAAAK